MVRDAQDGSMGDGLAPLVARGAAAAAVVATGLLALALLAELLRRRRRARRLVAAVDRVLPSGVRVAVVALITVVTAMTGVRPVGATDSVRGWLGHGPSSTTTTTVTSALPATSSTTVPGITPSTTLAPPVVLEPPITLEDLDPPTTDTAPPPSPAVPEPAAPAPTPAPSPPVAAPAAATYVVVRGDCLWSIAERQLGAGVDARTIDAGWRAIYAANRAAIGDDPNLIHVGLTLQLPPLHDRP